MKRKRLVALLGIFALILAVSPVFAQGGCGPWWPTPTPGPTPSSAWGWGCYPPSGPYNPGSANGPTGGWCGFYNNWSSGPLGMVSTQAVAMHILFPALAPNCPISQLADWASKPERVDHLDVNGEIDYYFILTYDASGNLTKVELFDAAEALVAYTTCEYNANGQLVKTINYDATGAELSYSDFIYNTAGQLVNVQTFVDGVPAYSLACLYNRSGQLSRVSQYNPSGVLQMYTNNTYNAKRQLSRTVSYSAGNAVLESRAYAYNRAGQMQRVSDYNNQRRLNGYSTYMRNGSGQPTNTNFYNAASTQTGGAFCYFNLP